MLDYSSSQILSSNFMGNFFIKIYEENLEFKNM